MADSTQYAQIFGLDLTPVITPDVADSDGGERSIEDSSMHGWTRCDLQEKGRNSVKYSGLCKSLNPEDIETVIAEFNNAEADCEFYPIDADRCIYAALASARYKQVEMANGGKNHIHASFQVISKEPFCYGARQGLSHDTDVALPAISGELMNEGTEDNTINYVRLSGYFDADLGYTKRVKLTANSTIIELIHQMMAHDVFEVSRQGDIIHSYRLDFNQVYESLQSDLWGEEFCNGGSIEDDLLTLDSGQIMVPFAGPLVVADTPPPRLEFFLQSGGPKIYRAFSSDLADIEEIEATPVKGRNIIEIPDCDGKDFVAIGIGGDCIVSEFYAELHRYIADFELPLIKPRDVFTITIEDSIHSNHIMGSLHADYRDKFWW